MNIVYKTHFLPTVLPNLSTAGIHTYCQTVKLVHTWMFSNSTCFFSQGKKKIFTFSNHFEKLAWKIIQIYILMFKIQVEYLNMFHNFKQYMNGNLIV